MTMSFAPDACHSPLLHNAPKTLSFANRRELAEGHFAAWQQLVREKLRELLGDTPEPVDLDLRIEWQKEHETFTETRFLFNSEANATVPCHLLVPRTGEAPFPVVICLQGHTTGMHISLGRVVYPGDEKSIEGGDRDFALQVVREGYAALVLEQRCFGERKDQRPETQRVFKHPCQHASMASILLGRTMIGERIWDVSCAIDALAEFPEIDSSRIGCMGNSGGGTITYYAACMDERIGIAMPSCAICTYADSIGSIDHCPDNYVPGALRYFEMGDLSCLIAPRPLLIVTGRHDPIFPFAGVEATFETVKEIYKAAGGENNCGLVVGEEGHRFYARQSWPIFRELSGW